MKNLRGYEGKQEQTGGDGGSAADLTRAIAAAYNGKSGADIWLRILREAEKARRAGTLTDAEIDEFYQQFAPMLDEGQRKQLKAVVERLKKI